jgi:hypothetical protein
MRVQHEGKVRSKGATDPHRVHGVGMHVDLCPPSGCMHARASWFFDVARYPEGIPDIKVTTSC